MSVSPYQNLQPRYASEVRALHDACVNVIAGCSRLAQACEEAEAMGGQVSVVNHETTITTGLRILIKTLGTVLFMQSLGLRCRRPTPVREANYVKTYLPAKG